MAATTAPLVRQSFVTAISAIVPASFSGTKFRQHVDELSIAEFGEKNPNAIMRLFSVIDSGRYTAPTVSGITEEWRESTFSIIVGYPITMRANKGNAGQMENLIDQDADLIDAAIGVRGFANFADSVIIADRWSRRIDDGAVSKYLVIETTHGYWRDRSHVAI